MYPRVLSSVLSSRSVGREGTSVLSLVRCAAGWVELARGRDGMVAHTPRTLEDIGRIFGITRERVRQIESEAFRKLQHPHRSRRRSGFLDEAGEAEEAEEAERSGESGEE